MYSQVAQRTAFRLTLALLLCAALLPLPYGSILRSVIAQGQGRGAARTPPGAGKPEGTLPDLDAVKSESQREREAVPPIPSTIRAPQNSGKPWDGRRVGDPFPKTDGDAEPGQTRRAHARRRASAAPPPVLDDQFVQNFFNWALGRTPTSAETTYWNDQFRVAYGQGQASLKLASIELGSTLFESADRKSVV